MMWDILCELRDRIGAQLPAPQIDRIYLGIDQLPRQTLRMDTPLLIIDDAGEFPIPDAILHHVRGYNVSFQMIVSNVDVDSTLKLLLTRWYELELFLFAYDNRWLERSSVRIVDEMQDFPTVDPGMMEAGENMAPTWRWRRAVIPYRKADCNQGYHTP